MIDLVESNYLFPEPPIYLEIGDWVYQKVEHYGNRTMMPMYVVGIGLDFVNGRINHDHQDQITCTYDDIKPIPITDEFIDLNKLRQTKVGESTLFAYREYGHWVLSLRRGHPNYGQSMTFRPGSVHELQHILRTMGITKPIMILKI